MQKNSNRKKTFLIFIPSVLILLCVCSAFIGIVAYNLNNMQNEEEYINNVEQYTEDLEVLHEELEKDVEKRFLETDKESNYNEFEENLEKSTDITSTIKDKVAEVRDYIDEQGYDNLEELNNKFLDYVDEIESSNEYYSSFLSGLDKAKGEIQNLYNIMDEVTDFDLSLDNLTRIYEESANELDDIVKRIREIDFDQEEVKEYIVENYTKLAIQIEEVLLSSSQKIDLRLQGLEKLDVKLDLEQLIDGSLDVMLNNKNSWLEEFWSSNSKVSEEIYGNFDNSNKKIENLNKDLGDYLSEKK